MVAETIDREGISPHEAVQLNRWKDGSLGPNVGDMRHAGPMVGLPLWQALTSCDAHSVVGPLPELIAYADGRITLRLKKPDKPSGPNKGETEEVVGARPESYADLSDVNCLPLPYIKHDYFGRPRPTDRSPTVGPIENLTEIARERTQILLWPNAFPDRPPASEMRIKLERKSIVGDWEK